MINCCKLYSTAPTVRSIALKRLLCISLLLHRSSSFHLSPLFCSRLNVCLKSRNRLFSSVGGGSKPPDDSNKGNKGEWSDFLDPNYQESENMQRAREYMSDTSLPINHDLPQNNIQNETLPASSSAIVAPNTLQAPAGELAPGGNITDLLARNPYIAVVTQLSPSELISKFTATAHPRVQNAVRQTILGLIGGLPKLAFDTTTITSGQRLASLMFQLQMTGYMFKNADYRLSLQQSLGGSDSSSRNGQFLISGSDDDIDDDDEDSSIVKKLPINSKVRGKLRIRYGSGSGNKNEDNSSKITPSVGGLEVEVDAAAYLSELRSEVSQLRSELMTSRKAKEEALRKDLLLYIRTLPERELRSLTSSMSPDVLVAMKGLVNAVISGIGEGQIGPETVTEQSGEAMAQLCMWQLAIGYNLRTLEVREEMKLSLASVTSSSQSDDDDFESGVDYSSGTGFLE